MKQMGEHSEQHYSDLDVEIIDTAVELDRLLRKISPDDRREWASELRASRNRIFDAFAILGRELGTPPSGVPPRPRHLRLLPSGRP